MILEDATKKAFGYYPRDLKPKSGKPILAACDGCGKVRETSKNDYHALCNSCAKKGRIFSEELKAKLSAATKGKNNPMFNKHHTEGTKALMSAARKGENNPMFGIERNGEKAPMFGKHHSRETKAKISAALWKGGRKLSLSKTKAKRKRELGYTLLMPLADGEVGHHVTNEFIIGIPAEVHNSIGGNRKKHRTRILQWLKANDKKKYKLVLSMLANNSYTFNSLSG